MSDCVPEFVDGSQRAIRVAVHHRLGDVRPIAALGNVLVSLNDMVGVLGHQMPVASFGACPEGGGVGGLRRASIRQDRFGVTVAKYGQVADGVHDGDRRRVGSRDNIGRRSVPRRHQEEAGPALRDPDVGGVQQSYRCSIAGLALAGFDFANEEVAVRLEDAGDVLEHDPFRLQFVNDAQELLNSQFLGFVRSRVLSRRPLRTDRLQSQANSAVGRNRREANSENLLHSPHPLADGLPETVRMAPAKDIRSEGFDDPNARIADSLWDGQHAMRFAPHYSISYGRL